MKTAIITMSIFISALCQAQLQKVDNKYQYTVIAPDSAEIRTKLLEIEAQLKEDLSCVGTFVHLVKKFAAVEISYKGHMEDDKYIFTSFKARGGISDIYVPIEQLPKKSKKYYLEVIETNFKSSFD